MIRLYILVEGQTEEQFVRNVLASHLSAFEVSAIPIIVATNRDRHGKKERGGGDWTKWRRDLQRLIGQQRGADVRFTTLFDLYKLPRNFPRLAEHCGVTDTKRRVNLLEDAMASEFGEWRLVPYLQRHEFEALVLASLDALEEVLEERDRPALHELRARVGTIPPEDVNDGEDTAPSRRLATSIPGYQKTVHGPLAVEGTGLEALRACCPRFNEWVMKLERLSEVGEP